MDNRMGWTVLLASLTLSCAGAAPATRPTPTPEPEVRRECWEFDSNEKWASAGGALCHEILRPASDDPDSSLRRSQLGRFVFEPHGAKKRVHRYTHTWAEGAAGSSYETFESADKTNVLVLRFCNACDGPGYVSATWTTPAGETMFDLGAPLRLGPTGVGPLVAGTEISIDEMDRLLVGYTTRETSYQAEGDTYKKLQVHLGKRPILEVFPDPDRADRLGRVRVLSPRVPTPFGNTGRPATGASDSTRCFAGADDASDTIICHPTSRGRISIIYQNPGFTTTAAVPLSKIRGQAVIAYDWTPDNPQP